jgi:hypothetical protein
MWEGFAKDLAEVLASGSPGLHSLGIAHWSTIHASTANRLLAHPW